MPRWAESTLPHTAKCVSSIRPCDVDRADDIWLYFPAEHKTEHHEKNRVIVLGPKARVLLMP